MATTADFKSVYLGSIPSWDTFCPILVYLLIILSILIQYISRQLNQEAMIKISKLARIANINRFIHAGRFGLVFNQIFNFSLRARKNQLILHTENDLQRIHKQKSNKKKEWSTIHEAKDPQFRVSLIGLPNCGKSTLFNCIVGENLAIVDKQAGMTRDRREYDIMNGLVKIIDTPGVEVSALGKKGPPAGNIKYDIFKQTITAIHQSDLIIVVIDINKPISSDEIQILKYLRKFNKSQQIIIACNKSQNILDESYVVNQVAKLAVEKVFVCSGLEGTGIFQIMQYIDSIIPQQLKEDLKNRKLERVRKFQLIVRKLKQQMKGLEEKGVNIRQWENDFRKINPNPQFNKDLDYQQVEEFLIKPQQAFSSTRGTQLKNLKMKNTIKICFIGRPNVGKSSLINEILGEQRLVVSETPHTTRDSSINKIVYKNRKIELIDTAGLDNHNIQRTQQDYLKKVQYSTMLHVRQSHVIVYVMDSYSAFKVQDFKLIREVLQEGRPVIIAVNKWEVIKQQYRYKAKNYLFKQIDLNLGHMIHGHPVVFVSAKMNDGIPHMIDSIIMAYDKWNSRISTGLLNNWLDKFKKLDNLPKDQECTLKINFLIQASVRPPHLIFFVNNKKIFKENYMRFVTQNIAKQFKMDGIPLRLTLRSTNKKQNDTAKKAEKIKKKQNPIKSKMEELRKKYRNFGL